MTIRPAESMELIDYLGGDQGFVAEERGQIIGYVAYNLKVPGTFYGHSLKVNEGSPKNVAARLFQSVRKKAKSLGFEKVTFGVDPRNSAMKRLIEHGKVEISHVWVETKV